MPPTRAATGGLYEELYARHNYHGFSRFTTGTTVARVVTEDLKRFADRGVLDVGCSHGRVVQLLWMGGVKASGVDVSATAIKSARKRLSRRERRCAPDNNAESCFQAAPATALPFADGAFDGIVSSDMLEHLLPSELPTMVTEFSRVAARFLLLQIATAPEKNKDPVERLRASSKEFADVTTLHTTLMSPREWTAAFTARGWSETGAWSTTDHKWLLLLLTRPNDEVGNVRPKLSGSLRFGPFANSSWARLDSPLSKSDG